MNALTWSVLSPEQTHLCLAAADLTALRLVLRDVDAAAGGAFLDSHSCNVEQVDILVDLYAHLIRFAMTRQMSPEKVSTLVAIVREVHRRGMHGRWTRVASYNLLRELVVQHSVSQPPFRVALFDVEDVQDIDDYLLSTYYRHYKMYYYAFVPSEVASLRMVELGALSEPPPTNLPPLINAIPEYEWRRSVEERERGKEEAAMTAQEAASSGMEEQRLREAGLRDPRYSDGVREQLESIRSAVAQQTFTRLDVLEQKLTAIEAMVEESATHSRPASKSASRR